MPSVRINRALTDLRMPPILNPEVSGFADEPADKHLLVPIDLQALYVDEGSEETFVTLPFELAGTGDKPPPQPEPFADGERRPAGVHLRWVPPDALLRGEIRDTGGSEEDLRLPLLPDRWVVLRILAPVGAAQPVLTGWVLEAERARAVPLAQWPAADEAKFKPQGRQIDPAELNGTAGGSPAWTAVYDAARNRFSFHDPLDDLDVLAPGGVTGDLATYLVAGWYSDPARDPLDPSRSAAPLYELLDELGWTVEEELGAIPRSQPPRSSLLHGQVHGVPVRGEAVADQIPDGADAELVLAQDDVEAVAALAASSLEGEPEERRALERVLAAFVNQLLLRLDTPDGLVDIEESEHAAGFAARPGGSGPPERLLPAAEGSHLPAGQLARSLAEGGASAPQFTDAERVEERSAPRFQQPIEPLVAVRGPKRSLIAHGDGRFAADGKLVCRWPSQVAEGAGEIDGAQLIPSLGDNLSPDIPEEVLRLARNVLTQDPFLTEWLAAAAAAGNPAVPPRLLVDRLAAEAVLRFGRVGTFDLPTLRGVEAGAEGGVDVDPVGSTVWSQPWIPLFLEWEVEAAVERRFDEWPLGPLDREAPAGFRAGKPRTFSGRSPIESGPARALADSVGAWVEEERRRDEEGRGEAGDEDTARLGEVAAALDVEHLDVVGARLDSLFEDLVEEAEGGRQVGAVGEVRLKRARLLDAFGRTVELPVKAVGVPVRSQAKGKGRLRIGPRLLHPSRWSFRFVDAADPSDKSREATVDQVEPEKSVNPVAGFLLPDHFDESLEVFDTAGQSLAQLLHEPEGKGVIWEIAPGLPGPPDAPPGHGLSSSPQEMLGDWAGALVAADARKRAGHPREKGAESALGALLRAIDTTLWSVDAFGSFGNEHLAGLVGRPVAVVRALLRLELSAPDALYPGSDPLTEEEIDAALAEQSFPVRVGELTRADDGLLGFFVDDDYDSVRVVDKVVRETGGIDHPYVSADDQLSLQLGKTVRLTLLMHPLGKVHLTSGILPRKSLRLAREWVNSGLAAMSPSVRVGPVLIGPDQVNLPKVASLPEDQVWTRRASPVTWKDDPIVAATQAALLPQRPATVEEGFIRVAPREERPG